MVSAISTIECNGIYKIFYVYIHIYLSLSLSSFVFGKSWTFHKVKAVSWQGCYSIATLLPLQRQVLTVRSCCNSWICASNSPHEQSHIVAIWWEHGSIMIPLCIHQRCHNWKQGWEPDSKSRGVDSVGWCFQFKETAICHNLSILPWKYANVSV